MREAKSFSKAGLKAPGLGDEAGTVVVGDWTAGAGGDSEPLVVEVGGAVVGAVVVVVTVLDASATSSKVDGGIEAMVVVVLGSG